MYSDGNNENNISIKSIITRRLLFDKGHVSHVKAWKQSLAGSIDYFN